MAADYIPTKQDALLAYVLNAAVLMTATPFLFGITPAEAATFNAAAQDFSVKLALVNNPLTKTKATVQDKNASRLQLLYTARPLLQYIKGNAGVPDSAKVALGLNLGNTKPTPVPPPASYPVLSVGATTPLQHTLEFHDISTPKSRGKPAGVSAMEVYCDVSGTPPTSVADAKFIGLATKQSFVATFTAADIGKIAYYWARWINAKGEPGPWSTAISMSVSG